MQKYDKFQCTVCRRTAQYEKSNIHAGPALCTITKACQGILLKIGETSLPAATVPIAGLTDWYPRNKKPIVKQKPKETNFWPLATSDRGTITIAIRQTEAEAMTTTNVALKLLQRRVEAVAHTQYIFRLTSGETAISGRDTLGKNLRISQDAMDDDRVDVVVNGIKVEGFTVTSAGRTIVLPAAYPTNSTVDIFVLNEKDAVEVEFQMMSNRLIGQGAGSWANVKWIEINNSESGLWETYWLYNILIPGGLSASAKIKFLGVHIDGDPIDNSRVKFLLAKSPYASADRVQQLVVNCANLSDDFIFKSTQNIPAQLQLDDSFITSIYPPVKIRRGFTPSTSSLTTDDVIPVESNEIKTDRIDDVLKSDYINGPV